jgi:hypothetical protein
MIPGIALTTEKTTGFQPVHESRDFALVSTHGVSQSSGGNFSCLYTTNQNHCFLGSHPELDEAAIEDFLQSDAGSKEQ